MPDEITPIRQQYLEIKRKYPDSIVFFRLGDFYETFDQDAEIASKELDIVLTGRNVAKGIRVPMAGIPYHAVENYLSRLISKGYHVAICEQVGEQPGKGLFSREVTRVVTPGTVTEPGLLPGKENNYLVSYIHIDGNAALAYADITTGEFAAAEFTNADALQILRAEINRIHPAEIVFPDSITPIEGIPGHLTPWQTWHFDHGRCFNTLCEQFNTITLDGFGLKNNPLAVQAAGSIIQYLRETQSGALKLLTGLHKYELSDFMVLDAVTRRNLELIETIRGESKSGTLLSVLDATTTAMGHRLLINWMNKPLLDVAKINYRLDSVEFFHQKGLLRAEFRQLLRKLGDLDRLTVRAQTGILQPGETAVLRSSLQEIPEVIRLLSAHQKDLPQLTDLDPCSDIADLLQTALVEDPPAMMSSEGYIAKGYSSELDGIYEASRHAREWIANLESVEKNRTGIKTLKVGYNKVFGYYIEISRAAADSAPSDYIRKQTLVNAERFITPELKEYETLVMNASDRIHEMELSIYRDLLNRISSRSVQLLTTSRVIAELDACAALAEVATVQNYTRPLVDNSNSLMIRGGRHPVVEKTLTSSRFIPNDVEFETGEIVRVITGPNMSGKSTYLRQTALIALMAQMGSFVPAESARIGLVDRIFTRIGAQDEIHSGQSTFMVEMVETANILHHATNRSLLVLDEIGRGTSTYDGISIAWAVIEYIHNHPDLRARTLFATHYHELIQMADVFPGIRNYNVAVTEANNQVVFLHKIIPGGADRSYGIHVAQLAGLPAPIISRANHMLVEMEAASGHQYRSNPIAAQQIALFPETNPLMDELKSLDVNSLTPIDALNKLYEFRKKYLKDRD